MLLALKAENGMFGSMSTALNDEYEQRWEERLRGRRLIIVPEPTNEMMDQWDSKFPSEKYLVVPSRPAPSDPLEYQLYVQATLDHLCQA